MSSSRKTLIACRVCDSVFLSTKALINHLDSHLVDEEATARIRKQLQLSHLMSSQKSNPFSNPFSNPQSQPAPATAPLPVPPSPQIQPYFNHNKQFYPPVQVSTLPPVPYLQRNSFDILPNPNPNPNPYPNPYPNTKAYNSSPARDLNAGFGSGFGKHSSVPFSGQTTQRMAATEDSRDNSRPFLSLLDYPIPQMMNSNCNGNCSDDYQLDLTLKL